MFVDTHAHLHFDAFAGEVEAVLARAREANVQRVINVGVGVRDSRKAVSLAQEYDNVWAAVGIHPHSANGVGEGSASIRALLDEKKVVAIGECGLDYAKSTADKKVQEGCLRSQIELALEKDLPLIFHVRDAFDDFFAIINDYREARGVVHCFSSTPANAHKALDRGFYIALNGIMTFTKDPEQLEAAKMIPLDRLLLETDCPYLAPAPHRGKRNEPAAVASIAEFLAHLRGEDVQQLANQTSQNAERLFKIETIV